MTIDVHKHTLVPSHSKLSEKEKEQLLQQYHISLRSLPKISQTDPAIKKLTVKNGDIVKVDRASRTAGVTTYFRAVMEE